MNDILLSDWDLDFKNGDLSVGNAQVQRQQLLVGTGKNDWKHSPDMGVEPDSFLDDESTTAFFSEVREQFRMDGMTAKLVQSKSGDIYINAE